MTASLATVALALALHAAGAEAQEARGHRSDSPSQSTRNETAGMKIRLKVGDQTVKATLLDSAAARDFAKLLPLTLTLNDLFGREKYGHLPRAISEEGQRARSYEVGHIAYWPPASDVAVFYRHDGQSIPAPGIILLGAIDSGVEALAFRGSKTVTFEVAE